MFGNPIKIGKNCVFIWDNNETMTGTVLVGS